MPDLKNGKRNVITAITFMLSIEISNIILLAILNGIKLSDINRLIIVVLLSFFLIRGNKFAKWVAIILASVGSLLWIRLGYQFIFNYDDLKWIPLSGQLRGPVKVLL